MTRQAARPLCLVAVVVICALAIAATGAPALAGGNPSVKAAIHLKAHPTSCTKSYPTFTKCENINTTWANLGDVDAMPVFYDLTAYSVTEFGLKWPAAWGSASWIRCKGDIAVGTIGNPGEGTSIAWTSCQTGWGIAPGYAWLAASEAGKVEICKNPATGDSGVVDCSPSPGPYYDYCIATFDGGVGGTAGDDPCVAPIVPLTLDKTDDIGAASCAFPGGGITYTLSYSNPNAGAVNNVVLTDFLPDDVDYVSSTGGGVYDAGDHKVVWSLGSVASGPGSVTVSVTVDPGATPGADLVNDCQIVSDETPVPKTDQLETRVCACSIDGPDTVCPGSKIQFCAPTGMTSYTWTASGNGSVFGSATQRCVTIWAGSNCGQTYTVHLRVVDGDITSECDKVVMVEDGQAPVITGCPANAAYQCLSQIPAPNTAAVAFTDNCSNVIVTHVGDVQSGSCEGAGVITVERTYRATDGCGNFDECVQTFTVDDTTPPTITGFPGGDSVGCLSEVPPADPGLVTATDNCGTPTVIWQQDQLTGQECSGTLHRTYRVSDECGNHVDSMQVFFIRDSIDPYFTSECPNNAEYECDEVPAAPSMTAADNCDTAVEVAFDEQRTDGACAYQYTLVRTWTATDDCGNDVQCIQTIAVDDTTAPVIDAFPADEDLQCLSELQPPNTALVSATDNCGTVTVTFIEDVVTGTACNGRVERTYRATDQCGNFVERTQTFDVLDTTDPEFTSCPNDTSLECDQVPAAPDLTATDNCDGDVSVGFDEQRTDGTCPEEYTLVRTWTATDDCGNQAQCVQTITVDDTTAPEFYHFPPNQDLQCVTDLPAPDLGQLAASDNCSGVTITWVGDVLVGSNCNGAVDRTYRATDDCGNYTDRHQAFTILDTTDPAFTTQCPADTSVECGQVPAAPAMTAADNCDDDVAVNFDEQRIDGPCADQYTLVRTWTATDDCGNDAVCTQTITVSDTEAPRLSCAADGRVPCGGPIVFTDPTVTDNCDATPTLNDLGMTSTPGPGPGEVTHTKCWTATDDCGNTSSQCCQNIIEEACEYQRLTLSKTDDSDDCFYAGDSITYTIDYGNPNALEVTGVVLTDLIPAGTGYVSSTGSGVWNAGNGTVTWSIGTLAGSGSGSVEVRVAIPAPVAPGSTLGNDCEIACAEAPTNTFHLDTQVCACLITGPTEVCPYKAYEFCGPAGMTSYDWTITGDGQIVSDRNTRCIQVEAGPGPLLGASGVPVCSYDYILHLTVGEPEGGTSECQLAVQGRDSIAPDLTCPRDTTFECDDIGDAGTATATDNCDDSPEIIYSDNIVPGTGPGCYLIERTWIATDDCSNTDQCTQYITVVDTTPPVLTCAPDETISCGEAVAFTEPTASDNCDGDVRVDEPTDETVTWDPVTRELRYTMCWRVSDDCGNESEECCQTITVQGCTFVPLRITKDDGLAVPAAPGDTITYAITVYNDNPVAVTSVSVVDQLPARANFVAADHIFGYDPADHDVTWNLASIPGLGSVQLIVVAEVDRQLVSEDVVNIASASCPQVFGSVEAAETTRVESGRLEVYVDVRPGFCPNPVNPKGTGQVPVAVLGTNDLDVTDIDASTILLGREGVAGTLAPVSWSVADVAEPFTGELCDCHTDGADGYPDLVLKFSNTDLFTALNLSAVRGRYVELILTGDLLDETDIVGSDCVRVLGKAENPGLGIAASKPTGFTMGAQVGLSGSDLSLAFALAEAGHVRVDVFDVQGRLVTRLVDTEMDAGDHSVGWNLTDQFGKRVPLGIYFARLSTAQTHVTKKLVVVE